jgi:hypothetical protein
MNRDRNKPLSWEALIQVVKSLPFYVQGPESSMTILFVVILYINLNVYQMVLHIGN